MQAVIFDLDGLMINSEDLSLAAWHQILLPYGKRLTDEDYSILIGMDSQASASHIIRVTGVPLAWEALAREHWERLLTLIDRELSPKPGLLALVDDLVKRGYPLAVASNSPIDYVERALTTIGVRGAFDCVVGRDHVAHGKPAPDVYLAAAAGLGADPPRCLALEDSPAGMQAALAAGMRCVVVPNEHLPNADFSGAHGRYSSLGMLRASLSTLLETLPDQHGVVLP